MHELNESTKRIIDVLLMSVTAAAAGASALTLADWALIVTIVVGVLNGIWTAIRIYRGLKHGTIAPE